MCPTFEILEHRRLLSVTVAESEPNNSRASADVIARMQDTDVTVSGQISGRGDHDWFSMPLEPGDVIGAATDGKDGLDTVLQLVNGAGELLVANDDSGTGGTFLPPESPLPRNHGAVLNSQLQYVIKEAGTYFLRISASENDTTGRYDLHLRVARPGLEAKPLGTKQILFLDFDGAKVDFGSFYDADTTAILRISPLARSLSAWGLTAADENAVVDRVLAEITAILRTYVRANGANGNSSDVDIRNSRDHRDTFGKDPLVSRVVVGALNDAESPTGVAQYLDVGNFKNDDEAIVNINFIGPALGQIPIQPPANVVSFVAHAMALFAAHEAGHIFGCFHTDQPSFFEGTPNIMDKDLIETVGPDFVFGSSDDIDLQFGVDEYEFGAGGVNDTLTTVSYGLTTGQGGGAPTSGVLRTWSPFADTTVKPTASAFAALEAEADNLI